jgi:hypothetical protein
MTISLTVLIQGSRVEDHPGYDAAWADAAAHGALRAYRAFPYLGLMTRRAWGNLWDDVAEHVRATDGDAVLLQYFHVPGLPDPRPFLQRLRRLPHRPVIAVSCGDPFGMHGEPPPPALLRAASMSDVVFSTSLGRLARQLVRAGAPRVVLLPHAACQIRFGARPEPLEADPPDIVFIGSRQGGRNPSRYLWWAGKQRARAVELLTRRYGSRFAVYGHGWAGNPSWRGPVPFELQAAACVGAQVVFGGFPGSWCDHYASDRPFIQATSGTPIVDLAVPGVDRLLRDGDEWVLAHDLEGAVDRIADVLEGRMDGARIGGRGADAVAARHMVPHRVAYMTAVLAAVRKKLDTGVAAPPSPPFVHDAGARPARPMMVGW